MHPFDLTRQPCNSDTTGIARQFHRPCSKDRLASEMPVQTVRSWMNRSDEQSVLQTAVTHVSGRLTVIRGPCANRRSVLYLRGSLRTPLNGALQHNVRRLLRHGHGRIVLNLSAVERLDARGVDELVRAYNIATAAGSMLEVEGATAWVRPILELVGLFEILTEGRSPTITSP